VLDMVRRVFPLAFVMAFVKVLVLDMVRRVFPLALMLEDDLQKEELKKP
ncbi:hypothetical protein Tco_0483007, partial [Tanacetum coccineum]